MRRVCIVGSAFSVMALASACASAAGAPRGFRVAASPDQITSRIGSRRLDGAAGAADDSMIAPSIADREGPRVSIRAEFTNVDQGRHVRADFHLGDDAYVLVGHIDADGVVRFGFPTDPGDDGFVKGNQSYQSSEFFAGFADEYRYRARDHSLLRSADAARDSYDGGFGYVFVIASWRPMRFDRVETDNTWDSFELAEEDYLRDPRPAIHELASLLAGDNREAYTVQFARYYNTLAGTSGYDAAGSGSAYCSGYVPMGFASTPFGFGISSLSTINGYRGGLGYDPFSSFGRDIRYRGQYFYYDALGDCYRPGSYGGYGHPGSYFIAQTPPAQPARPPRIFDLDGHSPPTPQPLNKPRMPNSGEDIGAGSAVHQSGRFSPEYRRRGLITADRANTDPVRAEPRIGPQPPAEQRTRLNIQDMINRAGQNYNGVSAPPYIRMETSDDRLMLQPRSEQAPRRVRSRPASTNEGRIYTRPAPPERAQPRYPRSESPRTEPPRMAPPPPIPAPRATPASSSSSSSSSSKRPTP